MEIVLAHLQVAVVCGGFGRSGGGAAPFRTNFEQLCSWIATSRNRSNGPESAAVHVHSGNYIAPMASLKKLRPK